MPLHLQHHKSYHPYNKDNVERVRRDEEAARLEEEAQDERRQLVDSEARLDLLRAQRKRKSDVSREERRIDVAEEKKDEEDEELESKAGALTQFNEQQQVRISHSRTNRVQTTASQASLVNNSGHINFWADEEGRPSSSSSSSSKRARSEVTRKGNTEHEAEKRAEKRRFEEQVTMFLGRPAKELQRWYQDSDLRSGTERTKSQEQRLEDAYKDSVRKRSNDPILSMPASHTSRREAESSAGSRGGTGIALGMQGSLSQDDMRSKAQQREAIEQARVEALLQARRRGAGSRLDETPTPAHSESREYSDQFYRDDVRAAHENRPRPRTSDSGSGKQDFRVGTQLIDPGGTTGPIDVREIGDPDPNTGDGGMLNVKKEEGVEEGFAPLPSGADTVPARPTSGLVPRHSDSSESASSTDSRGHPRESMYPVIFGEMIDTVLDHEAYLFTEAERVLLRSYSQMDYGARHLLARLIQRRSTWHRVDKLNYDVDISDKVKAVNALCTPNLHVVKLRDGQEQIDQDDMLVDRFCLSEQDMVEGFEEPLSLLTVEELKVLAKNMNRLKGVTTKTTIISALLTTKSQGTLHGFAAARNLDSASKRAQSAVLREQLAEVVGGCVRLCPNAQLLIDRVALVYYRGTELGGSALTTAVLSRSRKRTYPDYAWSRSAMLFASRAHLIGMQRALNLESQMDQWIEWDGSREAIAKAMSTFEAVYEDWKRAVREGESIAKDVHDLSAYNRMRFHPGWPLTRVVYKGVYVLGRLHKHEREAEVLRSLLAQRVFRRGRRGDWYDRLALITAHYPPSTAPNAVRKAKREALATSVQGIEDPDTHLIYHDTLQRRITRLESQLNLPFSEKHDFSYAKLLKCQDRVFRGIRLDRMMGERKGIFGVALPTPANRHGMSRESLVFDGESFAYRTPLRKVVKVERIQMKNEEGDSTEANSADACISVERREVRKDMHSVWRGLDGQPCRVESVVLQHYAEEGFKGYHCEGGILTMLFALLMWDILFMQVDGVFETPYQRQPLDLTEDSFSIVRGPVLRQRLIEIENTGGLHLIRQTDERERERKTWAVGCRWDEYSRQDLLEIAECMGGKALSVVSQMLAEEWSHCTAGMPDLCVWRFADKKVCFCEVKGPGDKLSDKQKLWIDVLLRAGLHVEVSKVEEA